MSWFLLFFASFIAYRIVLNSLFTAVKHFFKDSIVFVGVNTENTVQVDRQRFCRAAFEIKITLFLFTNMYEEMQID